jgi:hypothetical protein
MGNHVCVFQNSEMGDQVRGGRQHPLYYGTDMSIIRNGKPRMGIMMGKPSWRNLKSEIKWWNQVWENKEGRPSWREGTKVGRPKEWG